MKGYQSMKCPNCGAEMKEGSLYCEQCGQDIHIVPDFEPELDDDIQQTIKSIADDIWEQEQSKEREKGAKPPRETVSLDSGKKAPRGRGKGFVFAGILAVFLILGGAAGAFTYLYYSVEYQTDRARDLAAAGEYDRAIRYYGRAIELDEDNVDLKVELADVYYLKNNKMEYEYLLRDIVRDGNASWEQVESAYGKLIAIYRDRGDYQTIHDFLLESGDPSVWSAYQNYVALAPEFSVKAGYYSSIQPLKLTASGNGRIYYTLDGSDPDENSTLYTTPILLEDGDYTVKAFFVNDNGISSDMVAAEYHVTIEKLPPPKISAMSGEYQFPMMISVEEDNANVYYTTDGTDPSVSSTPYSAPIHMPLGKSEFRFIRVEDGRTSEVEKRAYHLVLNTDLRTAEAERIVVAYRLEIGRIWDEEGHFEEDNESTYRYQFQYVTNINGVDDFYVIAEFLRSPDGTVARTGSYYAVNIYTGELFRLQIENGNYTLVEIEREPQDVGGEVEEDV